MEEISTALQHGRDMHLIGLKGALDMAKVYKDTNGTLDDFIAYLEEKVAEETKLNEQYCEG